MGDRIPMVDYLVLDDPPYLQTNRCTGCGATYFDRRNACASCFGAEFVTEPVARDGRLVTYTIVAHAAPGVPVPFVAGVVDCDGVQVRTNILGVDADPARLSLGMPVRLATYPVGTDAAGTEAIGFGFEPSGPVAETTDRGAQP